MYKKNDLVVYENAGVCRVEDIQEIRFGNEEKKQYYVLHPLNGGGTLYTPVDNHKVCIRPVITKQEAMQIIESIPDTKLKSFDGLRSMDLESKYKDCMKSHSCGDLLRLEMSIYSKCKAARRLGKKVSELDDRYFKRLEDLVNGELSVALDIPKENVSDFIASNISKSGK
jgi:CarD family transcriptional regulator